MNPFSLGNLAGAGPVGAAARAGICVLLAGVSLPSPSPAADPPPSERAPGPPAHHVSAGPRLTDVRLVLEGMLDTNIDREPDPLRAVGGGASIEARLEAEPRPFRAWLDVEGGGQAFTKTDRWDRVTHQEELGIAFPLGPDAELRALGAFDARGSTEDGEIVNQGTVGGELWIHEGTGPTLRALGALRWRRFSDRSLYDEDIRMGGGELRQKVSEQVGVRAGYRYEDAGSETPDRSYFRHRLFGAYAIRFAGHDRAEMVVEHQWRRYPLDRFDIDGVELTRKDRRWIPSLTIKHRFPPGQEISLDYEYQHRLSNDPDKEFEAHRITVGLAWPLIH